MSKIDINSLIKSALESSYNANIKNTDAKRKSSIFVYELGKMLYDKSRYNSEDYKLKVVRWNYDKDIRIPGEWLLDITIIKDKEISDMSIERSKTRIPFKIIWAVESESNPSLTAFAEDFGKLLCIKSDNYLFLNGLRQITEKGRKDYIQRRIKTATVLLSDPSFIKNNFYLAFWPSPARSDGISLWDKSLTELLSMVKVTKL